MIGRWLDRGAWLYWAISFNVVVLMLDNLGPGKLLTTFHVMYQEAHSPFSPTVYILVRINLACLDHSMNLLILQFDQLSAGNYLVLSLREPKHTALTGQGGISVL
jgi:hypothetical protein